MKEIIKILLSYQLFIVIQLIGIFLAIFIGINVRYLSSPFDLFCIIFSILTSFLGSIYLLLHYLTYENKIKWFEFKKPIERKKLSLIFDLTKILSWIMLFVSFIYLFQCYLGISSNHIIYPVTFTILFVLIIFHFILAIKKYQSGLHDINTKQ